ncbi:3-ketosteroid reductase [Metarhizium rileyi]|uniref:3-keto-steroid reductase n=1 Tax=Metarhizium rileyi (strain RCEF 4871) TaxID=1649241 RepID=A0A167KHD4_METRR|nr:3-ketosteroid reductase [Metarhizium rileyi RCEF 4871]TWU73071.1 3-keto-steroid reductase [Metarhizium rileyi]
MGLTETASARPAPWESVPTHEQLFVLITGANSGIGLGIVQVLIDDFLATRSLSSHLIVIPTTRSGTKSLETIRVLREYAAQAAKTSKRLASRAGVDYKWEDAVARIHILSLTLDLCDIRGVGDFAYKLRHGTVSNPEGLDGEYLQDVRIPRLDSIVCNAAFGGWSGLNYLSAIWSFFAKGIIQTATWPEFKLSLPTCILNERQVYNYPAKPLLGEVFCACVFGHYMLAHGLLPLLSRPSKSEAPGRIVWSSSVEAVRRVFDINDIQCFMRPEAYESAKRLTDLLSLSSSLPAARPYASQFLTIDDDAEAAKKQLVKPRIYLTHPGVVASTLFPLPWFLFWAYELALIVCRWMGSPWHNVIGYNGAKAAAWIVLQDQETLDNLNAERVKWGSSTDNRLNVDVKKTEVEGWGWEGKPETADTIAADNAIGVLRKSVGRKVGIRDVTAEDIAEFEEVGAQCWQQLEELRAQWEDIIERENEKTA